MKKSSTRWIAIILVISLASALMPAALAASSFQAVVTSSLMKIYQQRSPYKVIGTLPKGTRVTVKAYSGQAALISYNGRTGIARVRDMSAVPDASTTPTTATSASTASSAPAAAKATSAQLAAAKEVTTNRATRVYSQPSTSASYVSVSSGTKLGLLAVSGSVAKVIYDDYIGYTPKAHLSGSSGASAATAQAAAETVRYDNVPVMTTASAKVYAKPSTDSSYVTVPKGTVMTLQAVKGSCAMVRRDGNIGYIAKGVLTTEVVAATPAPTAAPAATPSPSQNVSLSGSNEEITFKFLTGVAGYNTAAACGIMANIKYESGYKPTSVSAGGSSYGIAQWTGSRKTRLINWCKDNNYDYTSLVGQLYFLQYELKRYYPAVHNRLVKVANSAQGAYDAGYDFCYNFEAPSSRASRSVTRGDYARTTLWTRYRT